MSKIRDIPFPPTLKESGSMQSQLSREVMKERSMQDLQRGGQEVLKGMTK
jgi:hypothetical protein